MWKRPESRKERRRGQILGNLRRGARIADRPQRLEPRRAREIVVTGQRRPRRRAEVGFEADGITRLQGRCLAGGAYAHAVGLSVRLVLLRVRHPDREALALGGPRLDELHVATDFKRGRLRFEDGCA